MPATLHAVKNTPAPVNASPIIRQYLPPKGAKERLLGALLPW